MIIHRVILFFFCERDMPHGGSRRSCYDPWHTSSFADVQYPIPCLALAKNKKKSKKTNIAPSLQPILHDTGAS